MTIKILVFTLRECDARHFYRPLGTVTVGKRKFGVRAKIFLFSKMVQDYGNRSSDICLVMQAVRQAMHSLSLFVNSKVSIVLTQIICHYPA